MIPLSESEDLQTTDKVFLPGYARLNVPADTYVPLHDYFRMVSKLPGTYVENIMKCGTARLSFSVFDKCEPFCRLQTSMQAIDAS